MVTELYFKLMSITSIFVLILQFYNFFLFLKTLQLSYTRGLDNMRNIETKVSISSVSIHPCNCPFMYLYIIHQSIRPSTYPSICWPFPAMPVVRVSVYLPWRPADVYCDGVEYSSYQYGLHQYWISHSGLAGCPPAAYSNIVSRIVIIGAELWPSSLQATEYSQRKPEKNVFASISPTKASDFIFQRTWNLDHWEKTSMGFSESVCSPRTGRKGRMERWWKAKPNQGQNQAWKRALIFDTWCSSFFSSLPFSLSPSHIHLGVKAIDVLPLMAKRGLY